MEQHDDFLQFIFSTLSEGVALNEMIFNDAGEMVDYRILEVNDAFYRIADFVKGAPVPGRVATELYGMSEETIKAFWRKHKDAVNSAYSEMTSPISLRLFGVTASPFKNNRFVTSFQDITERKQVEKSLRASEEKLRGLYELSPLGIALTDMQGHYIEFNQAFQKICGYPEAELKSLDYWALTPKKYEADEARQLESLERTGYYGPYEKEYVRKDGSLVPLQLNGMLLNGSDGRKYIWSIVQDITERKQSEERFQKFFNLSPELACIASTDGHFLKINTRWQETLGYTEQEILSTPFLELIHPDDRDATINLVGKLKGGQSTPHFTNRYRCKDGSYRWFEWSSTEATDGHLLFATARDITQRKQDEEALQKIQSNLVAAQQLAKIGSWEWDVRNNTAIWSDETYRLFGMDKNDLSEHRQNFLNLIIPEDRARVDQALSDALSGTKKYDIEYEVRLADGQEKVIHALAEVIRDPDGKAMVLHGTVQDITEKKQAEQRIERLAHFDQLTGLPNRTLLVDHFRYAISLAQRNGEPLAVLFLDLDHFKDINDTLGHSIGDQLLLEVAKRLKATLREEDTVSRQGGDEFILILPGTNSDGAALVASKLIEAISQPLQLEHHELIVTPSIGIAIYPDDGESLESLSRNADVAMYRTKDGGRNNFSFFTPEMQVQSARNLKLANALRHAIARNEFFLHYQPQLSIQDGHIVGAEALLRWQHPEFGMVSPAEFIPVAEDTGQIIQIGEWVLRTAIRQLKDWMDRGMPPMTMAVNLSPIQFRQPRLTELVAGLLEEAKLAHKYLELELTEAATMDNPQEAIAVMNQLHAWGIRMSIDDFGTGYSSLSYLKQFKVYKLKIDQSFVRDITEDPEDKAIVTAIINMATSLGMQTIAEGVETSGQLALLRVLGCHEVQGYYFSKPLAAEQFEKFGKRS